MPCHLEPQPAVAGHDPEPRMQTRHRCHTGHANWAEVVQLYDALFALFGSPVVAVNRALAIAELQGPSPALEAMEEVAADVRLVEYQPTGPHARSCLPRLAHMTKRGAPTRSRSVLSAILRSAASYSGVSRPCRFRGGASSFAIVRGPAGLSELREELRQKTFRSGSFCKSARQGSRARASPIGLQWRPPGRVASATSRRAPLAFERGDLLQRSRSLNNGGKLNAKVDIGSSSFRTDNRRSGCVVRSSGTANDFAIAKSVGSRAGRLHQRWSALSIRTCLGLSSAFGLLLCTLRPLLWRARYPLRPWRWHY
jgi:hypothetical protein